MRTSRKSLFLLIFISITGSVSAGTIADASKKMLAQSPENAFKEAVARNDLRILTLPYCEDVAPGFDFRDYKGEELKNNDFGLSCHSLINDDEIKTLQKMEAWIAKYNALLHDKLTGTMPK